MVANSIRIALVLLENQQGQIALQLRSPVPGIANPDRWGIFGGHIEAGEKPEVGAVREIEEELTFQLDSSKLTFLETFPLGKNKSYFVFHYRVENEMDDAVLMEGEEFDFFAMEEIGQGVIRGREVVPHHLGLLNKFSAGAYPK